MAKGTWEWCPWKSVVRATAVDGRIGSISKNLEQRRFCEMLKNEAAAGSQEGAMTRGCSYLCPLSPLYLPPRNSCWGQRTERGIKFNRVSKEEQNIKALSLKNPLHPNATKRINHVFCVKSVVCWIFWTEVNLWSSQPQGSHLGKFLNELFSKQKFKMFLNGQNTINKNSSLYYVGAKVIAVWKFKNNCENRDYFWPNILLCW